MPAPHSPWWRGQRGEWYAVLQLALVVLVIFGPSTVGGVPTWPGGTRLLRICGVILIAGGLALGVAALRHLRTSITVLGGLKPESALVGWSLAAGGWLTLVYAIALAIVLDRKSTGEERRLLERFAAYRDYQLRTRKLVPLIY